jgi:adenylosuccinate synthase
MEHAIFPESTVICWCLIMIRMQEKVSHFSVTDYHLRALGTTVTGVGPAAVTRVNRITLSCHIFQHAVTTRRINMAKGQQRKTKEAKKPKKQPAPAKVIGAIIKHH